MMNIEITEEEAGEICDALSNAIEACYSALPDIDDEEQRLQHEAYIASLTALAERIAHHPAAPWAG